jgi:hypothetical protein
MARRLLWFVLLYAGALVAFGAIAYALRLLLATAS